MESWRTVVGIVGAVYGVSEAEMFSRSRTARVSHARIMAWSLLRERLWMSTPQIARCFDRDHTTIVQTTQKVDQSSAEYARLWNALEALQIEAQAEAAE